MLRSESIEKIAVAVAAAIPNFQPVELDKQGTHHHYASYGSLLKAVQIPLQQQGVIVVAAVDTENKRIDMRLIHAESQQYIGTYYPIYSTASNKLDENQRFGGGVTYAKRYALAALLGLQGADEEDPDNGKDRKAKDQTPSYNQHAIEEPEQETVNEQQIKELLLLKKEHPTFNYLFPKKQEDWLTLPLFEYQEIKSIIMGKK